MLLNTLEAQALGAYVMKLLAENYLQGRIDFESAAGRTSFTLTLPVMPDMTVI